MDTLNVNAKTRTASGKTAAKKLRLTGRLPAVMYNKKGEATMLDIDKAEFAKIRKVATPTTLVTLDVDGKKLLAFIKNTQYNILTETDEHVDFHVIDEKEPVKVKMKILTSGNPVGVREGGLLELGSREVIIQCLPKDLPVRIVADVSNLAMGAQIHIKDLPFEKSVKVLSDAQTVIAQVRGVKA